MDRHRLHDGDQPHNVSVLVVEDDPIVRDFCVRLLRMKGYAVSAAENGRAALALLPTAPFELVVTDLQMPVMGGIELLHAIRQQTSDIEVIIFTAYATVETAREALKLGAFDYLTKPVSIDDLDRTVRRAIEWHRAQREKQRLSEIVALYAISQAFTSTLDTEVAVREIVGLLSRYFAPRSLSLSLFHPEDGQLELLAHVVEGAERPAGTRSPLPPGQHEQALTQAHRALAAEQGDPEQPLLVSLLLRTNDRTVGVLRLTRAEDQPRFEERERTLLSICGSQIAASLDNSRLYRQQKEQYLQTIRAFAAMIDARDPYTRGHSEQVMRYAVRLAEELGMGAEQIERIRYGALLHDIGKIGVRDDILLKAGRLTPEERAAMSLHPRIGANILRHIESLRPVLPMVEHHHEHLDGRGYPDGLGGDAIAIEARILAIADAFDAMTSDRAYRKALPLETAMRELRDSRGTQLDPAFVDVFLALLEREGPALMALRGAEAAPVAP